MTRRIASKPPNAPNAEVRNGVCAVRNLGRIGKNSRAYYAAHYNHRGVKQSKLTARF
jgi:hypothetical protein